jgi:hypothetical protein
MKFKANASFPKVEKKRHLGRIFQLPLIPSQKVQDTSKSQMLNVTEKPLGIINS